MDIVYQKKNFDLIMRLTFSLTIIMSLCLASCSTSQERVKTVVNNMDDRIIKTEEEWKKELSPEEFHILREKGTERAFTGKYWNNHDKGIYYCGGCRLKLFSSDTKFESGSGWPSFYEPLDQENVAIERDTTFGMVREEVLCARCGGHLGHVFPDGPEPTGLRYCINSASLDFEKK